MGLFSGLKMQSVLWRQTWCSLIHSASQSETWHDLSPKGNFDFVLEESVSLWEQAGENKVICVDSWGLEPETNWGRETESGQGILRVQSWSVLCEGQHWRYLQSENHEPQ